MTKIGPQGYVNNFLYVVNSTVSPDVIVLVCGESEHFPDLDCIGGRLVLLRYSESIDQEQLEQFADYLAKLPNSPLIIWREHVKCPRHNRDYRLTDIQSKVLGRVKELEKLLSEIDQFSKSIIAWLYDDEFNWSSVYDFELNEWLPPLAHGKLGGSKN